MAAETEPAAGSPEAALHADAAARERAADPTASVLLQAPAGSGKTTVLVCRYLALLAIAAEPEEILAITFTRKAAAEMRRRVLDALRVARDGATGAPRLEQPYAERALANATARGWDLLATPARLRIQTIDAFNHAIVARLPVSAGIGADAEVAQPPEPLYAEAAQRTLAAALEDAELGAALEQLLERLDNDWARLEALLALMLATRAHWLPRMLAAEGPDLVARVQAGLEAMLRRVLGAAAAQLPAALAAEVCELAAYAATGLLRREPADADALAWHGTTAPLAAEPAELPRWRLLARLALTGKGEWRRKLDLRDGFPPKPSEPKQRMLAWIEAAGRVPELRAALAAVAALPHARLPEAEQAALAALSRLLHHAAAELQLVFAARGRFDHALVAGAARAALSEGGAPTDLALALGAGVRHVLVDEFQDTSAEQIGLLRALTAGWEEGDGRTLFAVGDPMQSIYQFREADVGLYLKAREQGIGERRFEPLALHRNFRSGPGIIDWVNAAFAALFPAADDTLLSAVRYLPSAAARSDPRGSVQVHGSLDAAPASEAARIVAIVRAARARDPQASIALLVSNRRHAWDAVAALRGAGFDVRGIRFEPLAERAVVRDLVTLARALQHGGDRIAWLALLRAPWCGLTLAALAALDPRTPAWPQLEAGAPAWTAMDRQRVARVVDALRPALGGGERGLPLAERVARCWQRLGGPGVYPEARDAEDAAAFLDALAGAPDAERITGGALEALAADTYAQSRPRPGAIEVLTMHAAKGLEWDVVIVPALGRRSMPDPEPLLHWIEFPNEATEPELLLAPVRASGALPERSVAATIRGLRRERQRLERMRLLYVTATRARCELHWLGAARPVEGGEVCRPESGTLLAALWPVLRASFLASLASTAAEAAASAEPAPLLERVPADWRAPAEPSLHTERLPLSLAEPEEAVEYSWVGLAGRAVGTIVHAELQRCAQAGAAGAESVRDAAFYGPWLDELGVPDAERAAAAERIRTALARTLADARGCWLLAGSHAEAGSEVRLTGFEDGRIISVAFDRSFVDADGVRWIVDFKTSTHEGGGREEFLAREAERYRAQLARYARLARRLGPQPVRTALYFPLLGEFREVDTGSETAGE